MSEIKALNELRTAAKGRNLENHEECNLLLIIADEIEAEIAERYMLAPVDADGVPIRIGDYLKLGKTHGHVIALTYSQYDELPWEWQCDSNSDWYNTKFTRHAEPRTVEDVLMDVMSDFADADFNDETLETITARYADEIRDMLGGDAE